MSVGRLDVELKLASGRAENTAPFKYTMPAARREPPVTPRLAAPQPRGPREYIASRALTQLPRPSWIAVLAAIIAAAGLVWWVMLQRLPEIDPGAVIATNLSSAERALNEGRYVDPPERSAFHHYSTVLALDPTNEDAVRGLDLIAERYLESAKTLIVNGRVADAVIALDNVRRVRPDHRRLPLLDAQLRREVDQHIVLQTHTATPLAASQATSQIRKTAQPPATETRAPRGEAPSVDTPRVDAQPSVREIDSRQASAMQPDATLRSSSLATTPAIPAAIPAEGGASADSIERTPAQTLDIDQSRAAMDPAQTPTPAADVAQTQDPAPIEPRLIKYVEPEYPRAAVLRGIEGWIDLSLSISSAGEVIEPRVEDGKGRQLFDRPALAAVRQWKYEPRPEADPTQRLTVRMKFELQ
ncbi:MAG: TonB family protein [Steroidobacter sp.]